MPAEFFERDKTLLYIRYQKRTLDPYLTNQMLNLNTQNKYFIKDIIYNLIGYSYANCGRRTYLQILSEFEIFTHSTLVCCFNIVNFFFCGLSGALGYSSSSILVGIFSHQLLFCIITRQFGGNVSGRHCFR